MEWLVLHFHCMFGRVVYKIRDFWLTCDLTAMVKVDPGNTGRVAPTEAALFLKKSGLPDVTLGKVTNTRVQRR